MFTSRLMRYGRVRGTYLDVRSGLVRLNKMIKLRQLGVVRHVAALDRLLDVGLAAHVRPNGVDPVLDSRSGAFGPGVNGVVAKEVFSSFGVVCFFDNTKFRPLVAWQIDKRLAAYGVAVDGGDEVFLNFSSALPTTTRTFVCNEVN